MRAGGWPVSSELMPTIAPGKRPIDTAGTREKRSLACLLTCLLTPITAPPPHNPLCPLHTSPALLIRPSHSYSGGTFVTVHSLLASIP